MREKREKAEAEDSAAEVLRRKRLLAAKTLEGFLSNGAVNLPDEVLLQDSTKGDKSQDSGNAAESMMPPPPPSATLESKHRFLPPPSGSAAFQRATPASSFMMPPPPVSAMRWGVVSGMPPPPSAGIITPVSGFVGMPGQPAGFGPSMDFRPGVIPTIMRKADEDTVVLTKPRLPKQVRALIFITLLHPRR